MPRSVLRPLRWLPLFALVPLLAGCSRAYTLVGDVVFVAAQDAAITEVVGGAIPKAGKPVANAIITLFHQLDDGRPVRDSRWIASAAADASGLFRLQDFASPGTANLVGFEVTAPGFETVFTTYVDYAEPDEQYFLVVMQPKR